MTLDIALSQPNQISSLRNNQPEVLTTVLNTSIVILCKSLNVTKTPDEWQISEIVETIVQSDKYWILKPEEILYVFKLANRGEFGTDYNRLDVKTVCDWLNQYIEKIRTPYWEEYNRNIGRKQEKSAEEMASFFLNYQQNAIKAAHGIDRENAEQRRLRQEEAKKFYYQQRFAEERGKPGFSLVKFDRMVKREIEYLSND